MGKSTYTIKNSLSIETFKKKVENYFLIKAKLT